MKIIIFKILVLLVIIAVLAQIVIDNVYIKGLLIVWAAFTELNVTYYNISRNLDESHLGYGILFGPFYTIYILFYK